MEFIRSLWRRASTTPSVAANVLLLYVVWRWVCLESYRQLRAHGVKGTVVDLYRYYKKFVFSILLRLPSSRDKVTSELLAARKGIESKLVPEDLEYYTSLPEKGKSLEWITGEMDKLKRMEKGDVAEGRVSGAVYHGGQELNEVIIAATSKFILSNPLHPDVFPGVRKMEAEIVAMCLKLFQNPTGAGTTTSGGTESILMAVKTHRDWAKATKGIKYPEMIIPSSAHAAFWKASDYFGVRLHVIPVDKVTRKANVAAMKRAINPNTILLVGSAPNFPDGAIDPIPALGHIARKANVGLHVDCCLGSLLMPFLRKTGYGEGIVGGFGFEVKGVTSMSCDIHKYGFCPKGSSVVMYRSAELRRYQYYVQPDWAGGVYASPSMAGSRPGSIIAGAWAVMTHMGVDGYSASCVTILKASRKLKHALQSPRFSSDLDVLGDPLVSVVAFTVRADSSLKQNDIYMVGDLLGKKGWHLNALSDPPALHLAMTMLTAKAVDNLLDDLHAALDQVKAEPSDSGDMVALYGLGQTSVGPLLVPKLAEMFIDTLYMTR